MKDLTPEQIYWITLIGIAGCSLLIGLVCGWVKGYGVGYDDAVDEFADPESCSPFDDDDDSDEILDSKLVTRNSELPISGRFL